MLFKRVHIDQNIKIQKMLILQFHIYLFIYLFCSTPNAGEIYISPGMQGYKEYTVHVAYTE